MSPYKLLAVLALLLISQLAYTQTDKEIARIKGREAIQLMDNGKVDESIVLLKEAQELDPGNFIYPYELAYAYYMKQDYKTAIKILENNRGHKDVEAILFQLLGNAYDLDGKPEKAIQTYDDGLKIFPTAGPLYLEKGNMHWIKEEYVKALPLYEKGIEVDPAFPSNYYRAARIYCNSSEKIWGVLYGEIFMNLERNSKRTAEISELLYTTYEEAISISSDTSGGVDFSKVMLVDGTKPFKLPFQMVYGLHMTMSITPTILAKEKEMTLSSLSSIRSMFLDNWFAQERQKDYPNMLFQYQQEIKNAGHFEAYNHWLFMKGRQAESDKWVDDNKEKWDRFIAWYSKNKLTISGANKFYSNQY